MFHCVWFHQCKFYRCHTFTKEINHARAGSRHFNENYYCKNCLPVFSAMTEKPPKKKFYFVVRVGNSDLPKSFSEKITVHSNKMKAHTEQRDLLS